MPRPLLHQVQPYSTTLGALHDARIEERRIRYVKVGRHVRIPESAFEEYIRARTVEPIRVRHRTGLRRAA
ncbi:excisionase family DNA-binding protein [Streptomyces sp. NPDC055966]|uniref:excisionase family DNA-binding protein n=1 Tax=Streptomyces sp. NPDC055966 TaxID=3345669 RepID=UPI0035E25663